MRFEDFCKKREGEVSKTSRGMMMMIKEVNLLKRRYRKKPLKVFSKKRRNLMLIWVREDPRV